MVIPLLYKAGGRDHHRSLLSTAETMGVTNDSSSGGNSGGCKPHSNCFCDGIQVGVQEPFGWHGNIRYYCFGVKSKDDGLTSNIAWESKRLTIGIQLILPIE
ncbi:hypothetical protein AVEN_71630-1 [Araneus ventricosus]|uniref:Uncharacterized protein n=1 Tax=Araneus ventricosus TaxID=182803 RepID=A0A4Y2GD38_ARAVE|nr:hypothetical protein AVEN_71630-1 [Araneus ventricosus]